MKKPISEEDSMYHLPLLNHELAEWGKQLLENHTNNSKPVPVMSEMRTADFRLHVFTLLMQHTESSGLNPQKHVEQAIEFTDKLLDTGNDK